jgi:ABC-2 type transport system ATP-binding protein
MEFDSAPGIVDVCVHMNRAKNLNSGNQNTVINPLSGPDATSPFRQVAPIELVNLVKDYGVMRAVDHVSLTMRPGEILGLLGPNGAGKTTIISTLVTLEKPTSGHVSIFGLDPHLEPERAKSLIGFVPQELIHYGYFDVYEIMEFQSGYFGLRHNRDRIDWILHKLSLWEQRKKKVKQLSGGMKRRLLIAKALVHEPKLLLLDEPTAGVDLELRSSLWRFVEELKKDGMSILLTTHYLEEAEVLCDRVGILQKGQLRQLGDTKDLIRDLTKREIVLRFKKATTPPQHSYLIQAEGREWVFRVPATMGCGDLLESLQLDLHNLEDISIREGSLEDALMQVLGVNIQKGAE